MQLPHGATVAIVDGEQFVLMRNQGDAAQIDLRPLDRPEVDGSNRSQGQKRPSISGAENDVKELAEAGHAAGAAQWLNHQVLTHAIDQLVVIADPRTLGEMRRHYHKELQARLLGEIAKTLTSADTAAIEKAISAA